MDRLLRGLIQIGSSPDADDCLQNWIKFQEHNLEFHTEEDKKIHEYLEKFYGQMQSPPDVSLVQEYFEKKDEIDVVTRINEIKKSQPFIKTNYLAIVRAELEQQQIRNFGLVCRDASVIAEHGRNLEKPVNGKKILRGINDAVNYVYESLHNFTRVESGEKLEGVVADDVNEVLDEYEKLEKQGKYINRNLFGLDPVDQACRGHKRGEYWIHAGFAGELKSSLALNYAYNNAMIYGKNIFYAILEMPYEQLRRQIYVIHSSHGKFVTEWNKKDGYIGLDYRDVRDGLLNPRDKERFKIIAQDFHATCKGKLYVWRPSEEVNIGDIRRKAEMFHNKYDCDGIVIDHLGLVNPKHRSNDHVVSVNSVVREARLLALNFARGRAVPVLALFQINRQGKLRADKNDGRYDFAAIQYANEVEKSADVLTYTYLNDALRAEGKFYLGNLKNRENQLFERMVGKIIWQSKRMRAIETGMLDMTNDRLLEASRKISLSASDMLL
jgi:replicative DNA helicase